MTPCSDLIAMEFEESTWKFHHCDEMMHQAHSIMKTLRSYFDTRIISVWAWRWIEISVLKSDNLERTNFDSIHVLFIFSLSLFLRYRWILFQDKLNTWPLGIIFACEIYFSVNMCVAIIRFKKLIQLNLICNQNIQLFMQENFN